MGEPIFLSMKIPADEMGEFMANMDLAVNEAHDRYVERLRFAAAAVCALDWSDNDADAVATIIELKNALEGVAETWARPEADPTAVAADDAVEQVKRDLNIRGEDEFVKMVEGMSGGNRAQEIRLTCLHAVLNTRGPSYGNALGIVADAAALADYVMNGVNPAGHSPPEPKSDPTAVPSTDDLVEELKQEFSARGAGRTNSQMAILREKYPEADDWNISIKGDESYHKPGVGWFKVYPDAPAEFMGDDTFHHQV